MIKRKIYDERQEKKAPIAGNWRTVESNQQVTNKESQADDWGDDNSNIPF